jgi:hypothetical protein
MCQLGDVRENWRIILKCILREIAVDFIQLVMGFREYSNGSSDSIKCGECLDRLSKYQISRNTMLQLQSMLRRPHRSHC